MCVIMVIVNKWKVMNKIQKFFIASFISTIIGGSGILSASVGAVPLVNTSDAAFAETSTATITYPYYGFVEDPDDPWGSVYDALDETGTVEYSDDFFMVPSPGDHPRLRALSYALALAGFENEADGYPSTDDTPNPKLTKMLNEMGFSDYQYWDLASDPDGHSMGTTIGHKTLPSGQELVVIAPRNYNYLTEWISNLNVGTSGDHNGFAEAANLIVDRFTEYVASRDLKNYKVWVTGYSRGGAVTDLFAKYINESIENYDFAPDDFYAYTFGAPKASIAETRFSNIHDVKDGDDLLLGYVFPEKWGFHNTGVYEEISPADLVISTSIVDITDIADSSRVMSLFFGNPDPVKKVGEMNGREFMDAWMDFVIDNGLTRDYFNSEVRPPLSAFLKAYQTRKIDKQGALLNFITDTEHGLAAMIIGKDFEDLNSVDYPEPSTEDPSDDQNTNSLDNFPTYRDIVKLLKGTATSADIDELVAKLTSYLGEYSEYESLWGTPAVTEAEFNIIKTNLPLLVKALAPIVNADAAYTQATYGEDSSLYYTYTLGSNARDLVYGHIPESLMPLLKSLIPTEFPTTPEAGANTSTIQGSSASTYVAVAFVTITTMFGAATMLTKRRR